MQVFVTGASGFIGTVLRGDLDDLAADPREARTRA